MITSFSDSVAVALSAPSRRRSRGLDLLLWAPAERHGEVGDLVINIASRLGSRPSLVDLGAAKSGDLRDRLDRDSLRRVDTVVVGDVTPPGINDGLLIVDGAQLGRGHSWQPVRVLVEEVQPGPVVVVLDSDRGLPLDLSGSFVHLELADDEPLRDHRLLTPRAPLSVDLRQVDRVIGGWAATHASILAAIDDFREERWTEAYEEGHSFSRISRHAVPRPWTYRLAARAAASASLWGVSPDRLLRGCIGPRLGGVLAQALADKAVERIALAPPSSEGSAG